MHLLMACALWSPALETGRLVTPFCSPPCRSCGGWRSGNHHAQILSVWRHCERGIQNGEQQFAWVSFTALCKHDTAVPPVPCLWPEGIFRRPICIVSTVSHLESKIIIHFRSQALQAGFCTVLSTEPRERTWLPHSRTSRSKQSSTHIIKSLKRRAAVGKLVWYRARQ